MKVKKVAIGVFLAFALVAVFSMNADATLGWHACTIEQIGSNTMGSTATCVVLLKATSGAFRQWFTIPADQYKTTLAIMLTAISNGMTVNVQVDPDIADYHVSYVRNMYLLAG